MPSGGVVYAPFVRLQSATTCRWESCSHCGHSINGARNHNRDRVSLPAGAEAAQDKAAASPRSEPAEHNILFILTDQEGYFRKGELPDGYRLLAHKRLARKGVVFENHRIASCVCTSSRSVLYTGRHIQQTKMFDNTNFPWIGSMSTEIPTLGHMLR